MDCQVHGQCAGCLTKVFYERELRGDDGIVVNAYPEFKSSAGCESCGKFLNPEETGQQPDFCRICQRLMCGLCRLNGEECFPCKNGTGEWYRGKLEGAYQLLRRHPTCYTCFHRPASVVCLRCGVGMCPLHTETTNTTTETLCKRCMSTAPWRNRKLQDKMQHANWYVDWLQEKDRVEFKDACEDVRRKTR